MKHCAYQHESGYIEHTLAFSKCAEKFVSSSSPFEQRDLHEIETLQHHRVGAEQIQNLSHVKWFQQNSFQVVNVEEDWWFMINDVNLAFNHIGILDSAFNLAD